MPDPQSDKPETPVLPQHVAIVMDGNGRWARQRSRPRHMGHQAGARTAREVVFACSEMGIPALTLFAFSSENWRRPAGEIRRLMELFRRAVKQAVPRLHENDVRIRFLGDPEPFPADLRERMRETELLTADNSGLRLNIAAGFGGRWDIVNATRHLAAEVQAGRLHPSQIDEERLAEALSLAGIGDPDLFIRTGGERRISNFFLWDLAYTELYFSERLWPDFGADALKEAVADFAERERRYGGIGTDRRERHA